MKLPRLHVTNLCLAGSILLIAAGCKSNTQPAPEQGRQVAPNAPAQQAVNPGAAPVAAPPARTGQQAQTAYPAASQERAPSVIPAGTRIVVTLDQTLSSKTAHAGDRFSATVAHPVRVDGNVLIHAGAPATGTVIDAKALGHFKGQAELAIRLDSVRAEGHTYQVSSSTIERVEKGKGKRTAALTGGGAGLGAILGGIAGGGRGVLIGGLAGAGAGGAGSALTGNKELVISAESALTFRLERNVSLN